jgi:N-terminal domain of ribose phosphate pyrophosphokinase
MRCRPSMSLTGISLFTMFSPLITLPVACRRSNARRVTAVIPYFGYKHHRRGSPISTKHNSRFLSSSSMDFAKMLQEMGVDRVIAVDIQRPGQGQEACFFDNNVPLETVLSTDHMVEYFKNNIALKSPVVVVAPNAECMKKARSFQLRFQEYLSSEVKIVAFFPKEAGSGFNDANHLELLGKAEVNKYEVKGVYLCADGCTVCSSQRVVNFALINNADSHTDSDFILVPFHSDRRGRCSYSR